MLPGNDAEIAQTRPHRALAGDKHLLAEMRLARDVVVMAVHHLVSGGERRNSARRADRLDNRCPSSARD